jgi:hypothetical protein
MSKGNELIVGVVVIALLLYVYQKTKKVTAAAAGAVAQANQATAEAASTLIQAGGPVTPLPIDIGAIGTQIQSDPTLMNTLFPEVSVR